MPHHILLLGPCKSEAPNRLPRLQNFLSTLLVNNITDTTPPAPPLPPPPLTTLLTSVVASVRFCKFTDPATTEIKTYVHSISPQGFLSLPHAPPSPPSKVDIDLASSIMQYHLELRELNKKRRNPRRQEKKKVATSPTHPTISAIVLGGGLEVEETAALLALVRDTEKCVIQSIADNLAFNEQQNGVSGSSEFGLTVQKQTQIDRPPPLKIVAKVPVITITHDEERFKTMAEELKFYKALSPPLRLEADDSGTIGPGKVAKCVRAFFEKRGRGHITITPPSPPHPLPLPHPPPQPPTPNIKDQPHFRCRTCRTPLFTAQQFEDPPHSPATHSFNRRQKSGNYQVEGHSCESFFINVDSLPVDHFIRTGTKSNGMLSLDEGAQDGKLHCPNDKCGGKIGSFVMYGKQCR